MSLAGALVQAEERLRACGWTGARAFDELLEALRERLGDGDARPSDDARAIAAEVPLQTGEDLLGLAYERFFADLFKGRRGQFFTPQPVCELLVAGLEIEPGESVLDPTCGSGGLLLHAARAGGSVRGIELDPRLAQLAEVGMRLAGHPVEVRRADFFRAEPAQVDVVVANPPFSVALTTRDVLDRFALGRGRRSVTSDALFLEALERWVRPGGRAGVVLPWSILANPRHAAVRERVDAAWERLSVCQLPEGVFRPFGGAAGRAAILWLRRRDGSRRADPACRWAQVSDPGYDVRSSRYKRTNGREVADLGRGVGWSRLPPGAWVRPRASGDGVRVGDIASLAAPEGPPQPAPTWVADLADADRSTGEIRARPADSADHAGRRRLEGADVLVAKLRPNLGNVARAPDVSGTLVGSPEWVALATDHPGWVLHALRSPTFRAALPVTGGQTRPRTSAAAILDTRLPWPGADVADRVDEVSTAIFGARARLRARLQALQDAVDAFVAGEIDDEALLDRLADLEGDER